MFTQMQIAALKYLISVAQGGTDLTKRVMEFLIDHSAGLTKEVCVTLVEGRDGTADEIDKAARGVGRVMPEESLYHLFHAMGSEFHFSSHYGDFDPARGDEPMNCDGMFAGGEGFLSNPDPGMFKKGTPMRYTFWFAKGSYSRQAELIVASRKEINESK